MKGYRYKLNKLYLVAALLWLFGCIIKVITFVIEINAGEFIGIVDGIIMFFYAYALTWCFFRFKYDYIQITSDGIVISNQLFLQNRKIKFSEIETIVKKTNVLTIEGKSFESEINLNEITSNDREEVIEFLSQKTQFQIH